jgi:hypothetical protein
MKCPVVFATAAAHLNINLTPVKHVVKQHSNCQLQLLNIIKGSTRYFGGVQSLLQFRKMIIQWREYPWPNGIEWTVERAPDPPAV